MTIKSLVVLVQLLLHGNRTILRHIVHPPSSFCWGGGGGFKKEGFNGISILEGGCWERGSDFFQKGYNFYIKNKLKSEIFKDKKVYKQKYFSVLTKNLFKPGNFN